MALSDAYREFVAACQRSTRRIRIDTLLGARDAALHPGGFDLRKAASLAANALALVAEQGGGLDDVEAEFRRRVSTPDALAGTDLTLAERHASRRRDPDPAVLSHPDRPILSAPQPDTDLHRILLAAAGVNTDPVMPELARITIHPDDRQHVTLTLDNGLRVELHVQLA